MLAVHMALIIIYGMQKIAFHEDEYFTYYTSAGYEAINPYGSIQEKSGAELLGNFVVREEHRFDFSTVTAIQAVDVHPPLYYLTLNFLMSLFPNQFYKWFGILLNSVYSLAACGGVIFFLYHLDRSGHRYFLALLGGLLYAVHPAMISNVMFTRMYSMSVMWTALYMDVFVLLMRNYLGSRKRFAALTLCGAGICYFAFLTHYFCLYVLFFLTLGFCLYALCRKAFRGEKCLVRMLVYGASLSAGIGLAVLTFPASLEQIFGGYQGEGAFATLFETDLFYMYRLFRPVLDKNFFTGWMYPVVGIFAVCLFLGLAVRIKRRREGKAPGDKILAPSVLICTVSGFISVWLLCKTSQFLGDSASRYFYTAAVLLLPLIAYVISKAAFVLEGRFEGNRPVWLLPAVLSLLILLPAAVGHIRGNVLFLYREKAETLAYARENAQYPLVMVFNQDSRYRTWYIANEAWPFEQVIFVRNDEEATVLENEALQTAEKLIVYMDCSEDILDRMVAQNENLEGYSLLRHDPNFYVYVLE